MAVHRCEQVHGWERLIFVVATKTAIGATAGVVTGAQLVEKRVVDLPEGDRSPAGAKSP